MKTNYIFLLYFIAPITFYSQTLSKAQFLKDSAAIVKPKLVRPQVKFDNRQTYVENQGLSINGFDAGVLLKDKLRLTLGYYSLGSDLKQTTNINEKEFGRIIRMDYGSLNTEIIYSDTRFFSLGFPMEIGIGNSRLKYKDLVTDDIVKTEEGLIAMAHFGLSGTFKPIRWVGLKVLVGYRKTVFNQVKNFNFDGVFTSIGLNIDFQEIVRDAKMMRLKKKYHRGNQIENAVDLITD